MVQLLYRVKRYKVKRCTVTRYQMKAKEVQGTPLRYNTMRECACTHGSIHVEGVIGDGRVIVGLLSACSGQRPHQDDKRRGHAVCEPLLHVTARSRSRAEWLLWHSLSPRYIA